MGRLGGGRFAGVGGEDVEDIAQVARERGQLAGRGGVEDLQVDGPVAVHDPVPQAGGLLPGDIGEPVFDVARELRGCPAEYGEVPQQGLAAQLVGLQVFEGEAAGELVGWWARSAAWIISPGSRRSRCIQVPGLGEHGGLEPGVQGAQ